MTRVPAHPAWMQTRSGRAFDYLDPRAEQITERDVAFALAHINRFCGHLHDPVNVAQHSLLVAEIVKTLHPDAPPYAQRQAILHDAPEAFISDLPAPLKRLLPEYQQIEERVWFACAERFGIPVDLHGAVKQADWLACRLEAWRGFLSDPLGGWAGEDPLKTAPDSVIELLVAARDTHAWARQWQAALADTDGAS
ncbi:hydrolase [Deinococcus cavernae]|uniref:Hydrolase n=1 Tax=Deinococcus cavernae TaxID=2320857 RepID=A0A418VFS9_9DEIO|nr:hydrolase [Deinococcus cavernae]RJF74992.1 hydrolase [Deinococcus cavernae]